MEVPFQLEYRYCVRETSSHFTAWFQKIAIMPMPSRLLPPITEVLATENGTTVASQLTLLWDYQVSVVKLNTCVFYSQYHALFAPYFRSLTLFSTIFTPHHSCRLYLHSFHFTSQQLHVKWDSLSTRSQNECISIISKRNKEEHICVTLVLSYTPRIS